MSFAPLEKDECRLLDRAAGTAELPTLRACTAEALAEVSRREGIDFATALLYDRVWQSQAHAQFLNRLSEPGAVNASDNLAIGAIRRVVIVPGAFYRAYPFTGADGAKIAAAFAAEGYAVEVIPLRDFEPAARNAEGICRWLNEHVHAPTILVSLSKGGLDVKRALAAADAGTAFRHVAAWLDLSGILEGTALVSWLRRRRCRWWALRLFFRIKGYSLNALTELERGSHQALAHPARLPSELKVIHVVGFPLRRHLSDRGARRGHRRLAQLGPNDGGGILLADAVARAGVVVPVWGADHYLRPAWDIRPVVVRLAQVIEEESACSMPTAL
jgi:hypothetical protein